MRENGGGTIKTFTQPYRPSLTPAPLPQGEGLYFSLLPPGEGPGMRESGGGTIKIFTQPHHTSLTPAPLPQGEGLYPLFPP